MPTEKPFIDWVEEDDATGEVAAIYDKWLAANPHRDRMPEILKCFSSNPVVMQSLLQLAYPLQFADGALTRQDKEMIATLVSGLNQCPY